MACAHNAKTLLRQMIKQNKRACHITKFATAVPPKWRKTRYEDAVSVVMMHFYCHAEQGTDLLRASIGAWLYAAPHVADGNPWILLMRIC